MSALKTYRPIHLPGSCVEMITLWVKRDVPRLAEKSVSVETGRLFMNRLD